jgi:hypothetical protein
MAGTLHIFRRRIANDGEIYQVNFTLTGSTFAKVFAAPKELDEFLLVGVGLAPAALETLWQDINRAGNATLDEVEVSPQQATALGMSHADVDF